LTIKEDALIVASKVPWKLDRAARITAGCVLLHPIGIRYINNVNTFCDCYVLDHDEVFFLADRDHNRDFMIIMYSTFYSYDTMFVLLKPE
jgi:hypothetical protein